MSPISKVLSLKASGSTLPETLSSRSDVPIHEITTFSLFKKLLQFGVLNKINQNVDFFQNVENLEKNIDLMSSRHRDIEFSKFPKTFVCASNLPSKIRINYNFVVFDELVVPQTWFFRKSWFLLWRQMPTVFLILKSENSRFFRVFCTKLEILDL